MKLFIVSAIVTCALATCDFTSSQYISISTNFNTCTVAAGGIPSTQTWSPALCSCYSSYVTGMKAAGCGDQLAGSEQLLQTKCGSSPSSPPSSSSPPSPSSPPPPTLPTPPTPPSSSSACDDAKYQAAFTTWGTCLVAGGGKQKAICECDTAYVNDIDSAGCSENSAYSGIYDEYAKTIKDQCGGCFPATSTVELDSGKRINLDQLQLGDKVRVGPSEFSEVYFFSTEMAETTSKFVKLVTDSGAVTMTQGHYLYVNGALKVASDVQVGDNVVLGNGTHVAVNEVTSVWATGLYNPHTLHGDIVVDGIHTSTYTDAVHPTLAHALMSPLRTMYSAGISFGKEFRDTTKSMPTWLREAIQV